MFDICSALLCSAAAGLFVEMKLTKWLRTHHNYVYIVLLGKTKKGVAGWK